MSSTNPYYLKYRDSYLAKAKARRAADPEAARARAREYYAKNRERLLALDRARHQTPEYKASEKEKLRNWRKANPEKALAQSRRYNAKRPPLTDEQKAAKAAKHREWRKANPDKRRAEEHRRRARIRSAPGDNYTPAQFAAKSAEYGHRCFYCGIRDTPLVVEHQTPLCRGGSNDIDNLVPACQPCNARKGTKTLKEFLQ